MGVLKEEFQVSSLKSSVLELAKEIKSSNQREFCQKTLEMIHLPILLQLLKLTLRMVCILYLTGVLFLEMLIYPLHLVEEGLHSQADKAT